MNKGVERVLHVAPTPFFSDRGCHIRIRGIVVALGEKGIQNLVSTYGHGKDVAGVDTIRCRRISGFTKTEAGPSGYKYLADMLLLMTVVSAIRRFRPDVLHCHLHEGVLIGWLARLACLRPSLPMVFDMQGSLVGELEAYGYFRKIPVLRRVFSSIEAWLSRRSGAVICSSGESANFLTSQGLVPEGQVFVAPDGSDLSTPPVSRLRPSNSGSPVVVYAGGLSEAKGLSVLTEVIRIAAGRNIDVRFLIVGYPTEALVDYLRSAGCLQMAEIHGRVAYEELGEYLARATIAIEPKLTGSREASGKLINYMAAGLPVVCFRSSNNCDILGESGYFAEEPTAEGIVSQIEAAIADPAEATRRALEAKIRAQSHYTWGRTADTVLLAYSHVA